MKMDVFLNRLSLALVVVLFIPFFAGAQEEEHKELHRNRLSFVMAYGIIPEHSSEDPTSDYLFIVPAIGMNYDYLFTPKFGLGLHTDVILQKFEVKEFKDDLDVERSFPITANLMASLRPNEHWTFLAGGGVELDKNISYSMFALGIDYGLELNQSWEVGFNFMFEHRIQAYSSFLFGVGFTKVFSSSKTD